MKKRTIRRAMALSVAMAALLLPMVVFAQNSRFDKGGLFGTNPSQTETQGLMMSKGLVRSIYDEATGSVNQAFGASDGGLTFHDFGDTDVPLGGGIAILLLAGAGYVALKKKED